MLRLKYIVLTLALAELALGFISMRPVALTYFGTLLGVALLGLFLVAQLLERDPALLDEQNRAAALPLNEPIRTGAPSQNSRKVATHPVPANALAS
jgi:hypothetical protein